jgi:hypothetical protein
MHMTEPEDHKRNLRDLYAGFAMMGLLNGGVHTAKFRQTIPATAYDIAEAMIKEREERDRLTT